MSARFVAAVGLAELGNPAGVDWLLEKANPTDADRRQSLFTLNRNGRHFYAPTGELVKNCRKSLADLAEMNAADANDVEPLNNWWKMHKEQFTGGEVNLRFEPGGSLN